MGISSLFIYKLIQVSRHIDDNNNDNDKLLKAVITKNTILTLISFGVTVLVIIIFVIVSVTKLWWLAAYGILLDAFTNYICITLTFKYFDSIYFKMCGCIDAKCKNMVNTNSETNEAMIQQTQSNELMQSEMGIITNQDVENIIPETPV